MMDGAEAAFTIGPATTAKNNTTALIILFMDNNEQEQLDFKPRRFLAENSNIHSSFLKGNTFFKKFVYFKPLSIILKVLFRRFVFNNNSPAGNMLRTKLNSQKIQMKRWAILTVLIYVAALLLLTFPVVYVAFAGKNFSVQQAADVYFSWIYWIWLAVLAAGQALLLLVPIDISERRLPSRRKLKVPVIVSAFFLGNLFLAGILSVLCVIFKDNGLVIFDVEDLITWIANALSRNPAQPLEYHPSSIGLFIGLLFPVIICWIIWAIIFRRATRADAPDALIKRLTRWLLRGSILELLIVVPSHVIVRRRDDCCAPLGTFWGIATGISVMLLCFGPGVFFLFAERFQRLKPKKENPTVGSEGTSYSDASR